MRYEAAVKIEDIHSMMSSGHRSINIERHTLILWGLAGALLILVVNKLFTPDYIATLWQRTFFSNIFIASVLFLVAILDFRLTQRKREDREETISFVQIQLYKVWWLVVALIANNKYWHEYLWWWLFILSNRVGFGRHGFVCSRVIFSADAELDRSVFNLARAW